jgi:hypothetical protein
MPMKSADTEAVVTGGGGGKAEVAKYGQCVCSTLFQQLPQSILRLYL